jgi:hypothetical protein
VSDSTAPFSGKITRSFGAFCSISVSPYGGSISRAWSCSSGSAARTRFDSKSPAISLRFRIEPSGAAAQNGRLLNSGDILTVIFTIGDRVVRLRRTIDDLSDDLRDEERVKLLSALARIERQNIRLLGRVQARCPGIEH